MIRALHPRTRIILATPEQPVSCACDRKPHLASGLMPEGKGMRKGEAIAAPSSNVAKQAQNMNCSRSIMGPLRPRSRRADLGRSFGADPLRSARQPAFHKKQANRLGHPHMKRWKALRACRSGKPTNDLVHSPHRSSSLSCLLDCHARGVSQLLLGTRTSSRRSLILSTCANALRAGSRVPFRRSYR